MSRYYVRVLTPHSTTFLVSASHETGNVGAATRYPHPSAARKAWDSYQEKLRHTPRVKRLPVAQIIDSRDPTRVVEA